MASPPGVSGAETVRAAGGGAVAGGVDGGGAVVGGVDGGGAVAGGADGGGADGGGAVAGGAVAGGAVAGGAVAGVAVAGGAVAGGAERGEAGFGLLRTDWTLGKGIGKLPGSLCCTLWTRGLPNVSTPRCILFLLTSSVDTISSIVLNAFGEELSLLSKVGCKE